jgi:transposase
LVGAYRLSKRQIQQMASDPFRLSISTGMTSRPERRSAEALEAPYNELAAAVHSAGVIHADEISWRQEWRKTWLWMAETAMMTVFTIARNRNAKIAKAVLGTHDEAIAATDRCGSYDWLAGTHRQVCWSHRGRVFQAMIDRGGRADRSATAEAVRQVLPLVGPARGGRSRSPAGRRGDGTIAARGRGSPMNGYAWAESPKLFF